MTNRSDEVASIAIDNPEMSVSDIANVTGVTRQRVHQILQSRGIQTFGRRAAPRPRAGRQAPQCRVIPSSGGVDALSNTVVGTISEMLAATDLMARGFTVFFPMSRHAKCDLVALSKSGKTVLCIEVRSGKRKGKHLVFNKKPDDRCDHYAVVVYNEPVTYVPALPSGAP